MGGGFEKAYGGVNCFQEYNGLFGVRAPGARPEAGRIKHTPARAPARRSSLSITASLKTRPRARRYRSKPGGETTGPSKPCALSSSSAGSCAEFFIRTA